MFAEILNRGNIAVMAGDRGFYTSNLIKEI